MPTQSQAPLQTQLKSKILHKPPRNFRSFRIWWDVK